MSDDNKLLFYIREMLTEDELHDPTVLRRTARHLESLASFLETNSAERKNASADYGLYAIEYINEHFNEHINISELASHIGISRSYLNKLIKARAGLPPREYLIFIRLEYAKYYLRKTEDMICTILSMMQIKATGTADMTIVQTIFAAANPKAWAK